ncbi:MAG: DUF481 domain-containing protein [Exilibacterium sp.]
MRMLFSIIIFAFFPPYAVSEDDPGWSGSTELGLIFTQGNTNSTSAKTNIDVDQNLESWRNEYEVNMLFKEDQITDEETGEDETEKTAEKYSASFKSNYKLESDHSKLFIFISHSDDKFGGIRKYTTISGGWGSRIFETPNSYLDADIGPGYAFGEQAEDKDGEDGEDIEDIIVRISAAYLWTISENARFKQEFSTEAGEDNIRSILETSLTTKINSSFKMKLGVEVTHNSEVSDDTRNTDTESTISLLYSF